MSNPYKPSLISSKPPPPRQPYRRRRIIWALITLFALVFFFGAPWELPSSGFEGISRANIAELTKNKFKGSSWHPDEIFGLLHFVTRSDGRALNAELGLDPAKPIRWNVYEKGNGNWTKYVEELETDYPLVVFSKTYCPYSKKAKELLSKYDIIPAPKIIEVDLRDDTDLMKVLLTRLTTRGTFPNVILHGKSLGGSDDLQALHSEGKLRGVLVEGGLKVEGDVP